MVGVYIERCLKRRGLRGEERVRRGRIWRGSHEAKLFEIMGGRRGIALCSEYLGNSVKVLARVCVPVFVALCGRPWVVKCIGGSFGCSLGPTKMVFASTQSKASALWIFGLVW
ncbi:hypothetical protein SLA2020_187390 [Shorea laevis]